MGLSDQNLVTNVFDGLSTAIEVRFSIYGLREDLVEVLECSDDSLHPEFILQDLGLLCAAH